MEDKILLSISKEDLKDLLLEALKYRALAKYNIEKDYGYYYDALDEYATNLGFEGYENFYDGSLVEKYMEEMFNA